MENRGATIEEVIGANLKAERTKRGLSQSALGARLAPLLGDEWSPQAVSSAEKGRRAFAAGDLLALAVALDSTIETLLTVPPGSSIRSAGDQTLTASEVRQFVARDRPTFRSFKDVVAAQEHLRPLLAEALLEQFGDHAVEKAIDTALDRAVS